MNDPPEGTARRGAAGAVRRGARLLAVGIAALCLASTVSAREGAGQGTKKFLWEIRAGGGTVHLLGSIHLLRGEMYPLDRKIEEAFARSDVLVVESNVQDVAGEKLRARMLEEALYPENDTIENHVSRETLDLLRRRFPELPLDRVGRLRPWALAMTLVVLEYGRMGLDYDHGIDVYFLDKAGGTKPIRELESPDFVIGMLNGFSDGYQDLFLRYTLLDLETVGEQADRIIRAWNQGDEAMMEEILGESVREHPALFPVFDALVFRRNVMMAAKIGEYLKEGREFFVVVGALHLVGKKGIVELLRGKGFSVEQR